MIRGVIFDMDGVLIDSNPLHEQAWVEYLTRLGIPHDGLDTWMAGKRNDFIMRRLLGPDASEEEVFAHGAAKEALYRSKMRPVLERHLTRGLREFLGRVAKLPVGLGTNAEPANVEFLLREAKLENHFRAIVDGHQVERPKPATDIYLRVAERLAVHPAECVIFEDSPSGIAAARAAGARVVGVSQRGGALDGTELTISHFADPALEQWWRREQPANGRAHL
ncbi:MAG: HAD family phosphatase [Acidobacteria bacterium]|nr:HAD family phosphatase [Acidobacteriota bacterium]